jgi:hypothetical protein
MMAEYIKLEDAIAIIEEKQKDLCPVGRYGRGYVYGTDREKYDSWDEIIDALENIPSADVVPVVWCKDCKYFNHEHMECENEAVSTDHEGGAQYSLNFWLNDFCSYGERKETE